MAAKRSTQIKMHFFSMPNVHTRPSFCFFSASKLRLIFVSIVARGKMIKETVQEKKKRASKRKVKDDNVKA